jgi:hypothetical protein
MRQSSVICILVFALQAAASLNAQSLGSNYFEAGLGFFPYLTWGSTVDSQLSSLSTSRLQLGLHVHLGKMIARNLYIVGGYDTVADEVLQNGAFVSQISASLISAGVRLYPLEKGLVLGADAGLSLLDGFVALGYGVAAIVAWDFSLLGLNFEVGARTTYLSFDYASPAYSFGVAPFVAFVVK